MLILDLHVPSWDRDWLGLGKQSSSLLDPAGWAPLLL